MNAVNSPAGVWDGAPAEIDFGAFYPLNLASGGNNFNDFPESQLPSFRDWYGGRHTCHTASGATDCAFLSHYSCSDYQMFDFIQALCRIVGSFYVCTE